ALDEEDPAKLQEELGDLLLHVLFQTQIAREANEFTLAGVGEHLAAKLIRRHPHVFGDVQVRSAQDVVENWERIKREEKKKVGKKNETVIDANIPRELPALARAQKILERARRAGIPAPAVRGIPSLAAPIKAARNRERL